MLGISFYPEEEEMRKRKSLLWTVIGLLVVTSMLLASCAPAATAAPTEAPVVTEAPTEVATEAPATSAATEAPTEAAIDRNYSPDIPDPTEPVTV